MVIASLTELVDRAKESNDRIRGRSDGPAAAPAGHPCVTGKRRKLAASMNEIVPATLRVAGRSMLVGGRWSIADLRITSDTCGPAGEVAAPSLSQ
jgi:hypothetical protein